jgi:hypothetical protein
MLDAVRAAAHDELAELFDAIAIYDKPNQTHELRATVTPELVPEGRNPDRATPGRGNLP